MASLQVVQVVTEVTSELVGTRVVELVVQGPQGPTGATGATGPAGEGVPDGGTAGQSLVKQSATDYDSDWDVVGSDGLQVGLTVGTAIPDGGGTYYGLPQGVVHNNTGTLAGSRPVLTYAPFLVTRAMTITDALFNINTVNTATLEIYVQQADEDWQPIAATIQTIGTGLDALASGVNEVTGLSVTLQPGRWLTTIKHDTNNLGLRLYSSLIPNTPMMTTASPTNVARIWQTSAAATTNSDPWSSVAAFSIIGNAAHPVLYKWVWA